MDLRQNVEVFFDVIDARYVRDYVVWLKFEDGLTGEVDLSGELCGEVFEPLNDIAYFKDFTIDFGTIAWANGADFAPEFLYELVRK